MQPTFQLWERQPWLLKTYLVFTHVCVVVEQKMHRHSVTKMFTTGSFAKPRYYTLGTLHCQGRFLRLCFDFASFQYRSEACIIYPDSISLSREEFEIFRRVCAPCDVDRGIRPGPSEHGDRLRQPNNGNCLLRVVASPITAHYVG